MSQRILVVFDVSSRDTFNQTRVWIDSIRDSSADSNPIDVILGGTKCDLERAVTREEAEALAQQFQLPYFETSAKESTNVGEAFQELATMALKRRLAAGGKFDPTPRTNVIVTGAGQKKEGDCKC
jgi:GTPase SAR1 family protein